VTKKTFPVSPVGMGTVIDHIPHGQSKQILRIIKLKNELSPMTVGVNLPSSKLGLKDLIMISDELLAEACFHEIAIFAPNATINLVQNHKVIKKVKAILPDVIERLIVCPNEKCITRHEHMASLFYVKYHRQHVFLQCKYCEKLFKRDQIRDYVV
jgi:aspartate carbamoyltransferase regulatory subunit